MTDEEHDERLRKVIAGTIKCPHDDVDLSYEIESIGEVKK